MIDRFAPDLRTPLERRWATRPGHFPRAHGQTSVDVAIVGGGVTGLTTGYLLKRAGLKVAILEALRVGAGATGGSAGRLSVLQAPVYFPLEAQLGVHAARAYADASWWAVTEVPRIARNLHIDCALTRRPALMYTTDSRKVETVDREIEAARRAGLGVEKITDTDLPFPIQAGAYLTDQVHLDPLSFCFGLARHLDGEGSCVFEKSRVIEVSDQGDPLWVHTENDATVRATWVVMACGLPPIDRGGYFARSYPSRSYYLALEADGPLPASMSLSIDEPIRWIPTTAWPGGSAVLLAAGAEHRLGSGFDAQERYDHLEAATRHHFPVGRILARWSSQGYTPVDGIAMIGRVPFGSPHLLVATGLWEDGLTIAPAAARILADLVLDHPNPWTELFDASRSRFPTSSWDMARNQATPVARSTRVRLRSLRDTPPEALTSGSAGICQRRGEAVAAFRDESGALHVVSSTCTHRGCEVTWNSTEQTWDCPCHGSRFGIDGEVLHGPAVLPLKTI